jgi:sugar phosphate isomerase/epimerase
LIPASRAAMMIRDISGSGRPGFWTAGDALMSLPLTRRQLLRTGATAAAAAGASWLGGPAAATVAGSDRERKFTMDLVCGNLGVKADLPEAIALAHRNGFESVAPDAAYLNGRDEGQIRDLLADLKAKGLVWGAAALPVDFRADDARFRQGMRALPASAAALQRAGVTRVGTWVRPAHAELTYSANFRQHARRLGEVAGILDDHGLRLGLEYVGPKTSWTAARHAFVHTMAEMKELIAAIGRGNVGLVLDSWHWYTAGETEADLLSLAGRDVVACDLNDAPAGVPVDQQKDLVRDLPCATGVIDLKTFLGALVQIGYDGPVRAEPFKAELRKMPKEEAVAAAARAMKQAFALVP